MTHPTQDRSLPEPGSLLFAYGTLQRGGQYHHLLKDCGARFAGTGKLSLPYPLILAEYPCLLDQPGKGLRVEGELFEVRRTPDWEALDWLEDHPHEYVRRLEEVETGDHIVTAWTYFYQFPERLDPSLAPVASFRTT